MRSTATQSGSEQNLRGVAINPLEISIVDYGMGNVGSIMNMIKKVGGRSRISSDPAEIRNAKKIILPGVGNFDMGMQHLQERGLDTALNSARADDATIFGICLGMQLMTRESEESDRNGLGWFDYPTRKFPNEVRPGERLLVPHMGWNSVTTEFSHHGDSKYVEDGRFYFVHSYYVDAAGTAECLATTTYGNVTFASSIGLKNTLGVQFHPEKSHKFGMALFTRFVNC